MIDLLPDPDQQALLDSVTDFLHNEMPVSRLRSRSGELEAPPHPDRWHEFANLGWFGIGLGEEAGGLGLTLSEETLVARELGRHLVSPAVIAAAIAAKLLAETDPAQAGAIACGTVRVGLACPPDHAAQGYYLIDAPDAGLVLMAGSDSLSLHQTAAFSERQTVSAFDGTLPLERATLPDATPIAVAGLSLLQGARVQWLAMLTGVAEAALQLAVEYVKVREQFGQPIAQFQAIKHLAADQATRVEAAWCQTVLAALSVQAGSPGARFEVAAAEMLVAATVVEITEQCIQMHGGIGYTAECDGHNFLKRARLVVHLLGDPRQAVQRMLADPIPS